MGQKVHPYGFRLGVNKPWRSRWFVERDYDKLLIEDVHLREELKEKLKAAGVSSVEIERPGIPWFRVRRYGGEHGWSSGITSSQNGKFHPKNWEIDGLSVPYLCADLSWTNDEEDSNQQQRRQ